MMKHLTAQLFRFAWVNVQCCFFALCLFLGLVVSAVVSLPIPRYDALLVYVLLLTFGFWVLRLETGREVAVIFGFHLVGLGLELYKVRAGSWSYPEEAWTKVAGVPLYSGFMYAAVGSYICQAWRRFDLRIWGYPAAIATVLAVAIYINFFTHHFWPDMRWVLAALMVIVLWKSWVFFSVGGESYRLPLSLSYVLIGLFLWFAENLATFLGAWRYPYQSDAWHLVHPSKFGAWALLVSLSFAMVALVKSSEGKLYGDRSRPSTVVTTSAAHMPPELSLPVEPAVAVEKLKPEQQQR